MPKISRARMRVPKAEPTAGARMSGASVPASSRSERRVARLAAALRRFDSQPGLLAAAQRARQRMPGDSRYGDSLSVSGDRPPELLGRQLAALAGERPSVLRELGLGALQLWQGLSEAQGRGFGDQQLAIMFADIVDFSTWALDAGDDRALQLLRSVDAVLADSIEGRSGRIVKRLGDGVMAVFAEPAAAVDAAHEAAGRTLRIELDGFHPRLRTGVHVGRPRRLGGDYFGVDVNVAARLAGAAAASELLVSEPVLGYLDTSRVRLSRRHAFAAKGTPHDLAVYLAEPPPAAAPPR